ncbi:hypothetical protein R9C00_16715 [Flammeovirgaceae bacterium SG7u.111]|nr:hypothetical protein [Flammeovirgaceae bacterium SG7u.132]WPO33346.1 hypothetical protein R9C00_16715 [Flammeovirgaceae bacterium SG7u.111]
MLMKIQLQGLYYKITGQKKKLSPLFEFSDGRSYQEWIDEDNYNERVHELQIELGIIKKKKDLEDVEFIWCVIGNIVNKLEYGLKKEIIRGSKHFSPGTRVHCFPPLWGDGYEKIKVIGRHRKSKRFITIIMKSDLIENWRVTKIYHPFIIRQMFQENGWDDTEKSKMDSSKLVISITELTKDKNTEHNNG